MTARPIPALTAVEIDAELDRVAADADRIASTLVALEGHPGHQFLSGARLTGRTAELWRATAGNIALLYERYGQYQSVLTKAREVRARRGRPGPTELAELTALLRGKAVELSTEDIPLDRRNLTGPATVTRSLTLAELVATMETTFQNVADVVIAADEVWSAYLRELDPLEAKLSGARDLVGELGLGELRHPLFVSVGELSDELADLRAKAFGDPLALYQGVLGKGSPDLGPVREVADRLTPVLSQLDLLGELRADFDTQIARATAGIDRVAAEQDAARRERAVVLDKIAGPAIDVVTDATPELRRRVDQLRELASGQRWPELPGYFSGLVSATADALAAATAVRDTAAALLGRRSELRGRLDAYKVKAARLRLTEIPEVAAQYQAAHDLLWTSPCDLRAATKALNRYQQAIVARG